MFWNPKMAVDIYQGGHHGLAGEIDPRGAGRHLQFAASPDLGKAPALDHERGVLDGGAVACDQPRALVDSGGWRLCECRRYRDRCQYCAR